MIVSHEIRFALHIAFVIQKPTLAYQRKGHQMARDASHLEVQNYGMVCQPSQSRQPHSIVSRKIFQNCLPRVPFVLILGLNFITPL